MLLLKGGQREGDKERWMHGEKMLTDIDCGALLHLSAKGVDLHQRPAILTGPCTKVCLTLTLSLNHPLYFCWIGLISRC